MGRFNNCRSTPSHTIPPFDHPPPPWHSLISSTSITRSVALYHLTAFSNFFSAGVLWCVPYEPHQHPHPPCWRPPSSLVPIQSLFSSQSLDPYVPGLFLSFPPASLCPPSSHPSTTPLTTTSSSTSTSPLSTCLSTLYTIMSSNLSLLYVFPHPIFHTYSCSVIATLHPYIGTISFIRHSLCCTKPKPHDGGGACPWLFLGSTISGPRLGRETSTGLKGQLPRRCVFFFPP
jgi:hypothetical protein